MGGTARWVSGFGTAVLVAFLVALVTLQLSPMDVAAQRQPVDPRGVSLRPADLPRGFTVVESETVVEPLRVGQTDADIVGIHFKTVMERARTLEHLQSGPVTVSQMIARSDDPTRATFSLAAQREYNLREHGYEVLEAPAQAGELLCLTRRVGPFVEYRIDAVKNGDTLVSTTILGLPSSLNLNAAISLSQVSLGRYDQQTSEVLAAAPARQGADFRAVATPTPTPPPAPPTPAPGPPTQVPAPTAQSSPPAPLAPPAGSAVAAAPAPKVKLPSRIDDRLGQAWSELMSSTATLQSGEKLPAFLVRIVEKTELEVKIGSLRPNVGGELRTIASRDGDSMKIVESAITINRAVMDESPRVLAAMLAHEIVHAGQPVPQAGKNGMDCVDAEVEAYAVQARVWGAFWGQGQRPGQTRWERSMNYVTEVWQDSGEVGLRHLIREETDTDAHSCIN